MNSFHRCAWSALFASAMVLDGTLSPAYSQSHSALQNLVRYVNPLQGTDSVRSLSTGNTLPMIARPFAMTDWMLQTGGSGGWFFSRDARVLQGVRATHQPLDGRLRLFHRDGPEGKTLLEGGTTHLNLSPRRKHHHPHYLRVPLRRYSTLLEMTPTERCSVFHS